MTSDTAIVVLACRDYAAFELAMACHAKHLDPDVPFYILQNCRGSYDAERTLGVARKYARLYPRTIKVVDWLPPDAPHLNICRLLSSEEFAPFKHVCKIDDDAFPLTDDWLAKLRSACVDQDAAKNFAFVTPLINNNNWGFREVLKIMGLEAIYYSRIARDHLVGCPGGDQRIISANEIEAGGNGTIWNAPHIARWVHQQTSFEPDAFIRATTDLDPVVIDGSQRYSIGCILFDKEDWLNLSGESRDDEHLWQMHCIKKKLDILCVRAVPFVHLSYFTQREENRDIVEALKIVYEKRLDLPFPISLYRTAALELEARLRWLEDKTAVEAPPTPPVASSPIAESSGRSSFADILRKAFGRKTQS